jgi:hypothetical protein
MSLRHPEHHPVHVALIAGSGPCAIPCALPSAPAPSAVLRTSPARHGLDRDPLGMDYKDHTFLRNAPGIYAVRRP